jgi:surface polysaccharide O-acyltransferase-like enzyme
MKKNAPAREVFLDFLRVISCFLVIVNHTNSEIFLGEATASPMWFLSISYFFLSKVAVPVFFMISGYLLLGRNDSWKKNGQRIFRMVVVLIVCAFGYAFYRGFYLAPGTPLLQILKEGLAFYFYKPTNALWYLYTYIGLLIMLPFLQKMAAGMEKKDYWIFFALSAFFESTLPILHHYFTVARFNESFMLPLFGRYICMLFIGQYFARFGIKKSGKGFALAAGLFILSVGFNLGATYFEFQKDSSSYLFFDNCGYLPIVLASVCVFYMATFIKISPKISKAVSYLGACTFGIYLISDMTISFMRPFIYVKLCEVMNRLPAVILFEIAVFAIGLGITSLLRLIPGIKKFI